MAQALPGAQGEDLTFGGGQPAVGSAIFSQLTGVLGRPVADRKFLAELSASLQYLLKHCVQLRESMTPTPMDHGCPACRGEHGQRPVRDIDVLIRGEPDCDQLFGALRTAEERLGRSVEVTIRDADWLGSGTAPFHETLTSRPLLGVTSRC